VLVVRAPMRISFAGGGTDLPAYYERHQGMVVSTAIDKYVYVIVSPNGHGSLQVSSADYSTFIRHEGGQELPEDGRLRYVRAFLNEYGIREGQSVFIASEMPPGTGLGSSSALSVALVKSLSALQNQLPPKGQVAERAADVEIRRLHMPIGKQDHYASAFGGINAIYFSADGVEVEPLEISDETRTWLGRSILIFFTEQQHNSGNILAEQRHRSKEQDPATIDALHTIKGHAQEARQALLDGQPEKLGEIMHRSWTQKKKLAAGVTNQRIDAAYADAITAGALGGKIAGAGGGGFLMLVCPPGKQDAVSEAMRNHGLIQSDFHLDDAGSRILVNNVAA
jgi:D-glycero-alpha-D-manno-heptose-7-phosphate kinase